MNLSKNYARILIEKLKNDYFQTELRESELKTEKTV